MRDGSNPEVTRLIYQLFGLVVWLTFWVLIVEPGMSGPAIGLHILGFAIFVVFWVLVARVWPAECAARAERRRLREL